LHSKEFIGVDEINIANGDNSVRLSSLLISFPVNSGVSHPVEIVDTLVRVRSVDFFKISREITLMHLNCDESFNLSSNQSRCDVFQAHSREKMQVLNDFFQFAV